MQEKIQKDILDKIKKKEIKMTSKQYFWFKTFTIFSLSTFFLLLAFYVFAYVVFLFADNGLMYLPVLTQKGLVDFIIEIPWTLVVLGLTSLFLFSLTSKKLYKLYKKSFVSIFFIIFILIILSHIIFLESGAMKFIKEKAFENKIHLVPESLLGFRNSQTGSIFIGRIISTTTNSFVIIDRNNNLQEIFLGSINDMEDVNNLENANKIKLFRLGNMINAYTIKANGKITLKSVEIIK